MASTDKPTYPEIDCWTPGRIIDHLRDGRVVPADWRERLERAGYALPDEQKTFDV